MHHFRYHRAPVDQITRPRQWVSRGPQPVVCDRGRPTEREAGEIDLRKLCAAALAQLEAMQAKQRAKAAAATLAEADWRETARRAAPALARLRGQEGATTLPVEGVSYAGPSSTARRHAGYSHESSET